MSVHAFAFVQMICYVAGMTEQSSTSKVGSIEWLSLPAEKRVFRELEYACVYALGTASGDTLRVSWCLNPEKRLAGLQDGHWEPLVIKHIVWTAGQPLARRLETELHRELDARGLRVSGDWFTLTKEGAEEVFDAAIAGLKIPTFSHETMLSRIRFLREEQLRQAIYGAV